MSGLLDRKLQALGIPHREVPLGGGPDEVHLLAIKEEELPVAAVLVEEQAPEDPDGLCRKGR